MTHRWRVLIRGLLGQPEGLSSDCRLTKAGTRIYASEVADAYLMRRALVRGYAVIIWRGRHVVEPTELPLREAARYGRGPVWKAGATPGHGSRLAYRRPLNGRS
ncbi:hypothetical protein HEB94_008921 [Actinopolymorpha pittospori]|uniref:Uncharacterized protein n=1 Tax=Actinopolymorpha pittospori TaxID=648752 RepID=A0A927N8C0_9ACTN|nr:hypothetical protein [Actinopolymorpha pittospori]